MAILQNRKRTSTAAIFWMMKIAARPARIRMNISLKLIFFIFLHAKKPFLEYWMISMASPFLQFTHHVTIYFATSNDFLANNGALVGSNIRYATSFTRSLTRNHASAYPQTVSAQPQPIGGINTP
jgi:hypothetical protein